MYEFENYIIDQISDLEMITKALTKLINTAPNGYLKINHSRRGTTRYYQRQYDSSGILNESYIPKKTNLKLAQKLASKSYYKQLLEISNSELDTLKAFQASYHPKDKILCYENLPAERQSLIVPYIPTIDDFVNEWISKEFEPNPNYPEKLTHDTDRGEMVRSKSETIIANYLYANSDRYYYKYECPLELPNTHRIKYPDFTIINRKTGAIKYLEHAGMMDDSDYVDGFVRKISEYINNGIMPGKDLMITYETLNIPLIFKTFKIELEDFMNR